MKKQIDAKKTIYAIIMVNMIQIAATIAMVIYATMRQLTILAVTERTMLFLLLAFSALSAGVIIINVIPMLRMSEERRSLGRTLEETEKLNRKLRAQRHDFLNQLQVVYSLMELQEYESANAYIEKVYEDIQKVSSILKTDHAALNAILQAKTSMCKARGVDIHIEVGSRFGEIPIPVWQLCRIFGNIIDNAVTALTESHTANAAITVTLSETLKTYVFRIANNGPEIPQYLCTHIFDAGFTTKLEDGHGMGLTICRDLMEEYGGTLRVYSDSEQTVFEGMLPRHPIQDAQ